LGRVRELAPDEGAALDDPQDASMAFNVLSQARQTRH
jgi:hypothetical protein